MLVALGPAVQFGPMLLRGEALYWGTPLLQFVPWRGLSFDLIRQGILPLWNPFLGMGAPLLANHQSAILYPPNWLAMLLPLGWGEGLVAFAHLLLAAAGMVAVVRRLGLGPLAQVVGGLAFASGSYLVTRAGFLSLTATASWLPWLILASDRAAGAASQPLAARGRGEIGVLGLVIGLMGLAGHAQTLVYAILLAVAWSAWRVHGRAAGVRLGLMWLAAGAFGFALAAVQLIPTMEYYLLSSRGAGLDEAAALTYSFWPWRTLGLLAPGLFGSPASGDYWGYGNYWEDALYVGLFPLLMAIAGSVGARHLGPDRARLRVFLLGAAILSFVLALGFNTPLFPFLFRTVPFFDAFNAPTRLTLITGWCLAMLAALGAELWRRPSGRGLYWSRLGTAGAAAMMIVGVAAILVPTAIRPSLGRAVALTGAWLAAFGAVSLAWPPAPGRRWLALVAILIAADLGLAHLGIQPTASASLYRGETDLAGRLGRAHRVYLLSDAERILKFDRTHRFDTFQPDLDPRWIRESGLPNTLLLDRIPSANNFDPLVPARYTDWIAMVESLPPASRTPLLRLMDVGWLGSDVGDDAPWIEYEEISGARRVRLVPMAVSVESREEAFATVSSAGFDAESTVVLEGAGSEADRRGGPGVAEVVPGGDTGEVEVAVDAPDGGWIVLSDLWYPGWKATVDGEAAPTYPADAAFRAVWAPPGTGTVVWTYQPGSVVAGGLITAGAMAAGLIGRWNARRRA